MIRLLMLCLALLAGVPAIAQTPPDFRPGGATTSTNPMPVQLRCWNGASYQDCRASGASSTACTASVTTSAATPTGCTASGSAGSYVIGPFVPSPGYPVRLVATGIWSGSITIGTSVNSCAAVNGLTVAGLAYGVFTANANEAVDVPATTGGVAYCASVVVTSGTLNLALRQ